MRNWLSRINTRIAVSITLGMSTMTCVYLFLALSMIPLMVPAWTTIAMYISSTIIQLVALPLIMVGQGLMSEAQERRAAEDHQALITLVREMHAVLAEQGRERADLDTVLARLDTIEERICRALRR